jgi:hypothetical protein
MGGLQCGLSRVRFALRAVFLVSMGRKGVSGAGGYFMGYYTIWLAPVKNYFVPFWEFGKQADELLRQNIRNSTNAEVANGTPRVGMSQMLKTTCIILLAASPLTAQSLQQVHSGPTEEPRNVTFCDLGKDPAALNHELVRLTAFVMHGFEDFTLADPSCPELPNYFSVWLTFGGKAQSSTPYCCPGENGQTTRPESLVIEGTQIPLVADTTFESFTTLLKREPDTTVRVTLVGRFFSGEKETVRGSIHWHGFGHMGCCSLLAIQGVEAFEPHSRSDVDYSAEAGWYEKGGCDSDSLRYLRHVSISFANKEIKQVIAEQRLADSGARAWAFDDPMRVAAESLKLLYSKQVPVLQKVRSTPTREVFRWKNAKKSTIVVVTRPYWLSFYAKTNSVAWVSTTVKEGECR